MNIKSYLDKKASQKIAQPTKFPIEVKEFLLNQLKEKNSDNTEITHEDNFIRLAFFMYKHNLNFIDECGYEGCKKLKIYSKSVDGWNLRNGCCGEHAQFNTMLDNHKCINPMQSEDLKRKQQLSVFDSFGVLNPSQSDEIKEKKKVTTLENYGVTHNSQADEIKEKKKVTTLENYGVENPQQNTEISKKSAETRLEKYGFSYPLQNPCLREKADLTKLEKYGSIHVMHNADVAAKAEKHSKRWKDFIWKTGEISRVQGYEDIVLNELEKMGYSFKDIKTSKKDVPEIFYEFDGKKKRYYPDFYIPNENLIIEVKSEYTLNKEWDKNQAKFEATKKAGFNFKLEVR